MKRIILTGDRPTGRLHVGHYVGSLRRRVELQNEGNYDEMYVMIADAQALTDNAENPDETPPENPEDTQPGEPEIPEDNWLGEGNLWQNEQQTAQMP